MASKSGNSNKNLKSSKTDIKSKMKSTPPSSNEFNPDSKRALSLTEKRDLQEIFFLCDSDDSKKLDWTELVRALRGLGFPVTNNETKRIVRRVSKYDGYITLDHFYQVIEELGPMKNDFHREINQGFKLFTNGEKTITKESLRHLAKKLDEPLMDTEAARLIDLADFDGDGEVSLQDFQIIMSQTHLFRSSGLTMDDFFRRTFGANDLNL